MYHIFQLNLNQAVIDEVTHNDELLKACREALRIAEDDDYTLRWYKFPVKASTHHNPRTFLLPDALSLHV
jgi:hypothetical protein